MKANNVIQINTALLNMATEHSFIIGDYLIPQKTLALHYVTGGLTSSTISSKKEWGIIEGCPAIIKHIAEDYMVINSFHSSAGRVFKIHSKDYIYFDKADLVDDKIIAPKYPVQLNINEFNYRDEVKTFTKTIKTPVSVYLSEAAEKLIPSEFNEPSRNLAVLLKGKFNSAFNNRIKPVKLTKNLSKGASEIIVIADGNIAENQVDKGSPLELGFDKWTNNFYSNKVFLQNCVHHLMGNFPLLEIRNKEVEISFLDPKKVANQESLWKVSMLVLPLILLAILGFILFRYRTNKFGQ